MEKPVRIELPTVFGMKTVNAYLFKTPVPTLIDCGENTDASFAALETQLANQGLHISDIQRVIITHAHVDHIGMAQRIVEASDCQVWVSPLVYPWASNPSAEQAKRSEMIKSTFSAYVEEDDAFTAMFQNVRSLFQSITSFWQPISESALVQFELDSTLEIGGRSWKVIHAPGHCQNQTCFYDEVHKELISADAIIGITPTPVVENDPNDPSIRIKGLQIMLDTFEYLQNLEIEHVYPGHYKEIENPTDLITFQMTRIQQRVEECYAFIKGGSNRFSVLLNDLYPNRLSLPATNMLIGYLDILADRDLIQINNGIISLKS